MKAAVLWTLRQRRYARLLALLSVVALGCVGAGSFEVHRYLEKRHDNAVLTARAQAAPVPLTPRLVPLATSRRASDSSAVRLRRVTVAGQYVVTEQQYVANQSQGGRQGFYVLTPLRTASGVLLVARGFVPATAAELRPAQVAAPPAGTVHVTGRLEPGQTSSDQQGRLGHGEITSINPGQQATRLGTPVYAAWLSLSADSAGAAGLDALPAPSLSNPTGGASEWQLLSYVVQWYAFALLALIAPFLFSRAELRDARRQFLGVDEDSVQIDAEPPAALPGGDPAGGALVRRTRGEVVAGVDTDSERYRQAARLADRYGRSLSTSDPRRRAPAPDVPRVRRGIPDVALGMPVSPQAAAESGRTPHRSADTYHGSYNDYLWQLAMADGEQLPDAGPAGEQANRELAGEPAPEPQVIDADPVDTSGEPDG